MERLRDSVTGKVLSVVLMLCLTFLGSLLGFKALLASEYASAGSWRETQEYRELVREYGDRLASLYAYDQELLREDLSYVGRRQAESVLEQAAADLDPSATNFRYIVRDSGGAQLSTNLTQGESLPTPLYYGSFVLGQYYISEFGSSDYAESTIYYEYSVEPAAEGVQVTLETEQAAQVYTIECGAVEGAAEDGFSRLLQRYTEAAGSFQTWLVLSALCALGVLLSMGWVLWTGGHKAGREGITLTWQEKIFFELYLLPALCAGTAVFAGGVSLVEYIYHWERDSQELPMFLLAAASLCTLFAALCALTLRTMAVRLKGHCLVRSTLTFRVLSWMGRWLRRLWRAGVEFVRALPFLWRTVAAFGIYFFANLLFSYWAWYYRGVFLLLWWGVNLAALGLLCWWSASFRRLRRGSQAMVEGNLNHQIDTARMPHDIKQHAEDLNNLSLGLQTAVNEQMKSERFKAELITNVSHDLKTPLTSIINYVDLLKTTQQDDPKAREYIQVLDRKAQRLKKLTEDLVEASKASTGTLSVNREKIGMVQLVDQALGEYEERLEGRRLTLVTALPEEEAYVYADGRHLWRVIDNLLSNCCKYALEGTRVYLELTRGKGQVCLSVKNISRDPLNVPPERLMERFVRGDDSRTTEGSGLGLSIAKSLTELQGGSFELAVDGDLFKAIVTMPQAG